MLQDAHGGYEKFRPLFHFFFYRIAYDASTLQASDPIEHRGGDMKSHSLASHLVPHGRYP